MTTNQPTTHELLEEIRKAMLSYGPNDRVAPDMVAYTAIESLDPDNEAPELVRWGCVLELRQLARGELRKIYEDDPEDEQQDMFGDELPDKLPGFGSNKGFYIPLDEATREDFEGNIQRTEKEVKAKQRRLDKLRALYQEKIDKGLI